MVDQAERRRALRVEARLPLKLSVDASGAGDALVDGIETINISASGVYFRSPRFLEPMTKLAMSLELAAPAAGGGTVVDKPVQCQGLVVRIQPEQEQPQCDSYEVAVFFTWMDPEGQAVLQQHIDMVVGDS
jgi:hypothetical protein